VEVAGEGRAIPTAITGSNLPDTGALADGVTSGLLVTATDPTSLNVVVSSGTYNIDGVSYSYKANPATVGSNIVMQDPATLLMGTNIATLGATYSAHTLDAASSAGYYRYDAFVIGTDAVIDYIKGDESTSNPDKPTIPGDHILIGEYIFRSGGTSTVESGDIGKDWVDEVQVTMAIEIDSTELINYTWAWEGTASQQYSTKYIYLSFKDQYGQAISGNYALAASVISGTGYEMWDGDSYEEVITVSTSLSYFLITTRRDQQVTNGNTPIIIKYTVPIPDYNQTLTGLLFITEGAYGA
jgi:hypothetical protein